MQQFTGTEPTVASKKYPDFFTDLIDVVRKYAPQFPGSSLVAKRRAAQTYAATSLQNHSEHRKGTRGRSASGTLCAGCGLVIGEGQGEFHHPDKVETPELAVAY